MSYESFTTSDGVQIKSFTSGDPDGKRAGVIVIHEIWGLTGFIESYARRLSEAGFYTVAPHLFSRFGDALNPENIASTMREFWSLPPGKRRDPEAVKEIVERLPERSRKVAEILVMRRREMEELMLKDLAHVYQEFKPRTNGNIGVVGFCMGGGLAFEISTRLPFKATVVHYGANPKDLDSLAKVKGSILGLYAGNDPAINDGLPDLIRGVVKHGVDFEMKIYPGTNHAFATEGGPAYNEAAAKDAWERSLNFFKRHLG
jgi:carboxymethylenebutenolidase